MTFNYGSILGIAGGSGFQSPSGDSLSTATSGGSSTGKNKLYSVLLLDNPASVCLGTIGKYSSGVCVKTDCSTNHIGDKQDWKDEMFVVSKTSHVVFSTPIVLTNKMSRELKERFLNETKTLEEWNMAFAYVEELPPPVTIEAFDERISEKDAAASFIKTPYFRRNKSSDDDELSFVEVETFTSDSSEDLIQRVLSLETYLNRTTGLIGKAWDNMNRDVSQALGSNKYNTTQINDMVVSLGVKTISGIPHDFDSPSVWGTLGEIGRFVKEQEDTLRNVSIAEAVTKAKEMLDDEINHVKKVIAENFVERDIFQRFLNNLDARLIRDSTTVSEISSNQIRPLQSKLDDLERRIAALKVIPSDSSGMTMTNGDMCTGYGAFGLGGFPTGSLAMPPAVGRSTPDASAEILLLQDKILKLEKDFLKLKSDKDTTIVKFGALGFKELNDAQSYVSNTVGAMNFGLFVDIYVVCILVTKEIDGEIDFLKKLENVTKLNLNSLREATGMAAFSSPIPDLFTKAGGGLYGKNESAFSRYPSFQKWKESGKETIPEKLTTVKEGLLKAVTDYVPTSSPAHAVMTLSISESCANLRAFCEFLTQTVESLESYGMTTQKAWNLGTRLGESYFRTLHKQRSGVSQSFNTKDIQKIAAAIWFAVGQTLDTMSEFSNLEFKNHSVIAGEYIKFMVQNHNKNEASTFETKFNALEEKVKASKKDIEAVTKSVTTVGNKMDNLSKECQKKYMAKEDPRVKKFDERIKNLEGKL